MSGGRSSATYVLAHDDEDDILDPTLGETSAAIDPEAGAVDDGAIHERNKSRPHRCCLLLVVPVLILAAVGALLGVLFKQGIFGGDSSNVVTPANTGGSSTTGSKGKGTTTTKGPAKAPRHTVNVVGQSPHDKKAFLEGFEYAHGHFFESTGLTGQSTLRKVDMASGKVLQQYKFQNASLFGEGITLHKDHHIFMLTWKAGRGFIFDQKSFKLVKEWRYKGQGWALTMDRKKDEVYMSDGTSWLRVLDPETLAERRRFKVRLNGRSANYLNELEWICGEVWANVWQTKLIYRIDPKTGVVKSIIDASNLPLKEDVHVNQDVLNGIAFDPKKGRLWLTGKKWSKIYQVTVSDKSLDLTKCG